MQAKSKFIRRGLLGAATGGVNGLFGGGGGMVAVPLLRTLGYDDKEAHATAIYIIAPICAASALIYIINGFFNASVVIPAALGSVAGGLLGAEWLSKLPKKIIDGIFIAVMFAAGLRMML